MFALHDGDTVALKPLEGAALDGTNFSDVTDRIAVAVIAPVWLVQYAVRSVGTQAQTPHGDATP